MAHMSISHCFTIWINTRDEVFRHYIRSTLDHNVISSSLPIWYLFLVIVCWYPYDLYIMTCLRRLSWIPSYRVSPGCISLYRPEEKFPILNHQDQFILPLLRCDEKQNQSTFWILMILIFSWSKDNDMLTLLW